MEFYYLIYLEFHDLWGGDVGANKRGGRKIRSNVNQDMKDNAGKEIR